VIIPVKAALPGDSSTARGHRRAPGGAVVSAREKLVAYAAADS